MGFIGWIILGLVAGALAKFIMPGDDPGGILVTILLGIAGGVVGGWLGSLIGLGASGFIGTLITAVVGAIILLAVYRFIMTNRAKA